MFDSGHEISRLPRLHQFQTFSNYCSMRTNLVSLRDDKRRQDFREEGGLLCTQKKVVNHAHLITLCVRAFGASGYMHN